MKNLKTLFAVTAALSILFSACAPAGESSPEPASPTQPKETSHSPGGIAQSSIARDVNVSVSANKIQALADGNNAFALDLYRTLRSSDRNLILSPFSISLALAMTYAGARGETETQMSQALHFSGQEVHAAFNALDLELAKRGEVSGKGPTPLQLNIANAIWAEQTHPFQQEFLDVIARNYGAGIRLADFVNNFEAVRLEINKWVQEQTKGKIKDILGKGALDESTRMALVNAIYFKADWLNQFDPNNTHDAPFHLLDGSEAQVKMMEGLLNTIPYASGDGYQAVELPYAGRTAAMTILVPDEGNFAGFESTLDAPKLAAILKSMQPASVQLGLPKFTFKSQFNLPDQLAALGMTDAFDAGRADFSGMTGNRELYISDIVHQAFIAVDENGTEAAAATIAIMQLAMAPGSNLTLTIDRPFIFVIRDTASGQILFMGRVVNPAQ